jgi:hypothetical protein
MHSTLGDKDITLHMQSVQLLLGIGNFQHLRSRFFPFLYSLEKLQICLCIFRSTFCESSPVNIYHSVVLSQKRYSGVPLLASVSIFWVLTTKTKKKLRGSHV